MFGWPTVREENRTMLSKVKRSTPQGFWHTSLLPTRMQQDELRTNISAEATGSPLGESWSSWAKGRGLRQWSICLAGVKVWVQIPKSHIKRSSMMVCTYSPTNMRGRGRWILRRCQGASSGQCGKILVQWEILSQPLGRRHLWADTRP